MSYVLVKVYCPYCEISKVKKIVQRVRARGKKGGRRQGMTKESEKRQLWQNVITKKEIWQSIKLLQR